MKNLLFLLAILSISTGCESAKSSSALGSYSSDAGDKIIYDITFDSKSKVHEKATFLFGIRERKGTYSLNDDIISAYYENDESEYDKLMSPSSELFDGIRDLHSEEDLRKRVEAYKKKQPFPPLDTVQFRIIDESKIRLISVPLVSLELSKN